MKAKHNLRQSIDWLIDTVQHSRDVQARADAAERLRELADAVVERDAAERDLKALAGAAQVLVTLTKSLPVVKLGGAVGDSHAHLTKLLKLLGQIKRRQA